MHANSSLCWEGKTIIGGNSAKAVQTLHQKPYMQGLCVLHYWDSTRGWHSHFRWEIWTRSEVNFHKGIYLELQNFSNKSLKRFSLSIVFIRSIGQRPVCCKREVIVWLPWNPGYSVEVVCWQGCKSWLIWLSIPYGFPLQAKQITQRSKADFWKCDSSFLGRAEMCWIHLWNGVAALLCLRDPLITDCKNYSFSGSHYSCFQQKQCACLFWPKRRNSRALWQAPGANWAFLWAPPKSMRLTVLWGLSTLSSWNWAGSLNGK